MTAAVTVNGAGHRVKPLFILPNKCTLRTLETFEDSAYFASSSTGWMTKGLFRYYAMTFVTELSLIRLRLPASLREEPVLLFVDGHPSRWDFLANLIFCTFNVDVVTFPGHTSHLLQMFDVCLASPLKTEFKNQMIQGEFPDFDVTDPQANFSEYRKKSLRELRSLMIESFISAYEKTFTTRNCRKSFSATGVSPCCPPNRSRKPYAMPPRHPSIVPKRSGKASSCWLTSEEALAAMFRDEHGRDLQKEDLRVSLAQIDRDLRRSRIEHGIPLTETSEILASITDQKLYRLFSISSLT